MPALRRLPPDQGPPLAPFDDGVWRGGGRCSAFCRLPVRFEVAENAQSADRTHAGRCTPEYERVLARMGALLPYGRAVALMSEFLPLNDGPAVETARRRMLKVGARLEHASLTVNSNSPPEAKTLAVAVDGGHVKPLGDSSEVGSG